MLYAGAPKKVAFRLARTVHERACPTLVHTYIRTYNTWLYLISNLQSSSKATENLREKKRKIHLSNCWLYVDSLSIKTSRTARLYNDSSFSLFLELKKCHTTEQYWKCGRTKALYNFNMVEVFTSLRNLIITVEDPGEDRPPPPYFWTKLRQKKFSGDRPRPLYLRVWMTGPFPYLKVWIPALHNIQLIVDSFFFFFYK